MDFSDFQKQHINQADLGVMNPNEGDADFSLEHNKRVIAKTIEHQKRMARQKKREFEAGLQERTWAIGQFVKSVNSGKGESDVNKFFGRELIQQQIAQKYKMAWDDAKKREEALKAFKKNA